MLALLVLLHNRRMLVSQSSIGLVALVDLTVERVHHHSLDTVEQKHSGASRRVAVTHIDTLAGLGVKSLALCFIHFDKDSTAKHPQVSGALGHACEHMDRRLAVSPNEDVGM